MKAIYKRMRPTTVVKAFALVGLLFQGTAAAGQQLPLPGLQQLMCSQWPPEYNYAFESIGSFLQWTTQIIEATLYRADITTPMPYSALGMQLGLQRPNATYEMSLCEREDVAKCLYYGNSSNGLPKQLQGLFFLDGINIPEEITSPAGDWNPELRRLALCPACKGKWACSGNSSELAPGCPIWLTSGAAHCNLFIWWDFFIDIYYNQDINLGQLVGGINWLGYKVHAPLWILNWTQELQPDGLSWRRRSSAVFQNTSGGDYYWRAIVDGLGEPTRYFSKWLKAYDGRPFSYISNITP
eukprot:jgi/Botrbrau1/2356/Bobra.39_1s0040.1